MFRWLTRRLDTLVELHREYQQRLQLLEQRLHRMEHFDQGGRATYVGDGLVLVKCVVAGQQIVYFVESQDRLLSPWFITSGAYETELTDFFLRTLRPDDHCLDVGANFGFFTCLFARFAPQGQVIGVEPAPALYGLLRDNIYANNLHGHARAVQAAVTDRPCALTMHRRVGRSGNTSIFRPDEAFVRSLGEPPSEPFLVTGLTLDSMAQRMGGRVDVMKVDVEGAEPLVFAGAARTIAQNPGLQIVMEWSPEQIRSGGFDPAAFLATVEGMGLRFFDIEQQRLRPLTRDALLGLGYRAGILITRQPRQPV